MSQAPKARRSQLISTYGVGGLFPSENASFMIAGLQEWDQSKTEPTPESRLARSLGVRRLLKPPAGTRSDVPVIRFPLWQVCGNCHRIGRAQDFKSPWNRSECNLCKPAVPLTPSRLVVACPRGHIDDFPWFRWLHVGEGQYDTAVHAMTLRARGRTSSLADMRLSCSCNVEPVGLDGAFDAGALKGIARCSGTRPWLGADAREDCDEAPRTLQRGASNVWFGATRSAISIPPFSEAVARFVDREWDLLEDPEALNTPVLITGLVNKSQGRLTADEIVREARRRHDALNGENEPTEASLRCDEYKALVDGQQESGNDSEFVCLPRAVPDALADRISDVRKVTRLREVRALYGFSRLSGASGPKDPNMCVLSTDEVDWLPAIEVIGEGVFLAFDRARVTDWAATEFASAREQRLQGAANRAASAAGRDEAPTVDIAHVMLHTFAHVLIDQFALDAGYPASSIRERLFVDDEMAGLLLYTATSDSAGSLGGLAAQAEDDQLDRAIEEGLRRLSWCSSDPVCIESTGAGSDGMNLAACHSCVLVPETSCEEMNLLLDRALLFGTPDDPGAGFFSDLLE